MKTLFLFGLILSVSSTMPAFAADTNQNGEGQPAKAHGKWRQVLAPDEHEQWKAAHPEEAKRMEEKNAQWLATLPEEQKQLLKK